MSRIGRKVICFIHRAEHPTWILFALCWALIAKCRGVCVFRDARGGCTVSSCIGATVHQSVLLFLCSFVQEFIGDPLDGVTLLLELLRAVQLSQASQQTRCPPPVLRRALLDEHSCLQCIRSCLRCPDAARRLAASPAGLFTLAVCIMSNVSKSRVIALEVGSRALTTSVLGYTPFHGRARLREISGWARTW